MGNDGREGRRTQMDGLRQKSGSNSRPVNSSLQMYASKQGGAANANNNQNTLNINMNIMNIGVGNVGPNILGGVGVNNIMPNTTTNNLEMTAPVRHSNGPISASHAMQMS